MQQKDIYIDLEWFINQNVFLMGYAHTSTDCYGYAPQLLSSGQLYGKALTRNNLINLLDGTRYIFFYGPDIAMLEKFFSIDIRHNYKCINLLKIFRQALPWLPSYKLGDLELRYGINRGTRKYKSNIFQALRDWNNPSKRAMVLKYNLEDTINLFQLKEKIFFTQYINNDLLEENLLQGIDEIQQPQFERYTTELSIDFSKWFAA